MPASVPETTPLRPISEAPKDRPILAWCDRDADHGEMERRPDGSYRLTLYAARAEGMGHAHLTYDALLERDGGDYEATGSGPTPAAAAREAMKEIG